MKLIVLMYHRASPGAYGNDPTTLDAHFAYIARHYRGVLPGDTLDPHRINVCLSFDDGYYDFHAIVYPLLIKHGLRALLAVPVAFLQDRSSLSVTERLALCADRDVDARDVHRAADGHCSWSELAAMSADGRVAIAAHGLTHTRLDDATADLHQEIVVPQTLLAARLGCGVDSFVLPFGRFDDRVVAIARAHYRYVFRIGSADNTGWNGPMLYRIDADELLTADEPFAWQRLTGYRLRRHWNALRQR